MRAAWPAESWPAIETRAASQWQGWISTLIFILPTLFVVILGPAACDIKDALIT